VSNRMKLYVFDSERAYNSRDCLIDIEKQGYHLIIKKETTA